MTTYADKVDASSKAKYVAILHKHSKDGLLKSAQLAETLKECGFFFKEKHMDVIMNIADQDNNEGLDEAEFIDLMGFLSLVQNAFKNLDANSSGKMDRKDLPAALDAIGYKIKETQVSVLYQMCDAENSGIIEYDDYVYLILFYSFGTCFCLKSQMLMEVEKLDLMSCLIFFLCCWEKMQIQLKQNKFSPCWTQMALASFLLVNLSIWFSL
eukprot:TRINITY_DN6452_c0_g1_i1.p1 TRINITY_DN6452_c0_g1~~TRINITY_DN6452_c0_g1_i1.p1  ORF type:complete len:231 (-),score=70.29 TRINITY_DN6452_c0_g1_i1:178-810(-)